MPTEYTHFVDLAKEVEPPKDGILTRTLFNDDDVKAVIFGFGPGGRFGSGGDVIPFFSRRIGLDEDGNEVSLLMNAKLTSTTDGYSYGVLDSAAEEFLLASLQAGEGVFSATVGLANGDEASSGWISSR